MSDALNPRARAFLRSVQDGDDPTRADRDRVRTKVKARLAAGIAAGVAAIATSKAAASTVPAAVAASTTAAAATVAATTAASVAPAAVATAGSGLVLGKIAIALVLVGAVAGGTTAVVRHARSQPAPPPVVPAAITVASPSPPQNLPAMSHATVPVATVALAPAPVEPMVPAEDPAPVVAASPRSDRAPASVVVPPVPAPAPVQAPPEAPSIDDEIALVRDARAALRSGDASQALALLDDHDRRFPGGALSEDCAAARIYALCALGRTDQARALASRFLSEHPLSPHAASVRNSCGVSGGAN
jgi:hypothetical protein